jgi:hypothetical protein
MFTDVSGHVSSGLSTREDDFRSTSNISNLRRHDFSGQSLKHPRGRILTEGGMRIDSNAQQPPNALFLIRFNLDPDSNVTDESR